MKQLLEQHHTYNYLQKLVNLSKIRTYVDNTPTRTVIAEINAIEKMKDVKILIGAGMPGILYKVAIARSIEIL